MCQMGDNAAQTVSHRPALNRAHALLYKTSYREVACKNHNLETLNQFKILEQSEFGENRVGEGGREEIPNRRSNQTTVLNLHLYFLSPHLRIYSKTARLHYSSLIKRGYHQSLKISVSISKDVTMNQLASLPII